MRRDVEAGLEAVGAPKPQGRRGAVGQDVGPAGHPAARVDDDADGMRAGHGPHGEAAVVGEHGARADDDSVDERPKPVQVGAVVRSGDELGVPGPGGDEPVEALAELGNGEARAGSHEGAVEVEQGTRRRVAGEPGVAGRDVAREERAPRLVEFRERRLPPGAVHAANLATSRPRPRGAFRRRC